jgi:U5 snRNP spliceosome subunit
MPSLDWKLIWTLAALGLVSAAVTIWGGLGQGETWFGLAFALALGMIIAAKAPGRYFVHGFLVGTFGAVIEILAEVPFAARIMANNPELREAMAAVPSNVPPGLILVFAAPFAAPISGLVTGFIAWLVAKFLGKGKTPAAAPPQAPPAPPPVAPPPPPPPPSFNA